MTKNNKTTYDAIIIGGGASGFFSAIQIAEVKPNAKLLIIEKSAKVLEKVKISGGGRCNVTHACFEPQELVKHYPRGHKELLGAFHRFMCGDMMAWLDQHQLPTKIEEDGRVFPVSNSSQSIIDLFLRLTKKYHIKIWTKTTVENIEKQNNLWQITIAQQKIIARNLLIATGSNRKMWDTLKSFQHSIVKPLPSLFTFKIKDPLIANLPGVALPKVRAKVQGENKEEEGTLLVTHKGLSGSAILKLSAWQAVVLASKNYHFQLEINFIQQNFKDLLAQFKQMREKEPKTKLVSLNKSYKLPKRLWQNMIAICGLEQRNFAEVSNKNLEQLASVLTQYCFTANGKNTNKDEFVTCGGVALNEVNFKTMESKKQANLYFAGEVLNIDALTGGFNFQNAWTTAFIAGQAVAEGI